MLCLGYTNPEQMDSHRLTNPQKEELFIQYMKLFIPNPQTGFIEKMCKFISDECESHISLKEFSSIIREYLPHAQKHLKDYYMLKFRDKEKEGHLLKNFKSNILIEDAVILSMKINQLT